MTRDFLKGLGLESEVINSIMAENGRDVEKAKGDNEKLSAELEQAKADLVKANETLDSMKDYEVVKADIEKYKSDYEKSKADYETKIKDIELTSKIKDFTGSKKFVNDLTREAINSQLKQAVNDEANKGKSLEELLTGITEGKENIFVTENNPTPPVTPELGGNAISNESGVLAAFKRLNPNIKL